MQGPPPPSDGPDTEAATDVHPLPGTEADAEKTTEVQAAPARRRPGWRRPALVAVAAVLAVAAPVALVSVSGGDPDDAALVAPAPPPADPTGEPPTSEPATASNPPSASATSPAPSSATRAAPRGTAGGGAPGAPTPGWTLVSEESFGGSTLDPSHWFPYSGRTAGGVGQYEESNLSVADGVLTVTGQDGTSGGASWGPGQLYGRWEVRARADRGTGYGPVILLWPDAEDWPEGGEINIMEVPRGARDQSHFTVHYGHDNSTVTTGVDGDFSRWNTFAVEWTATYVAGFVNGREVFRTTDRDTIPPRPMHLAIQQDVGPFEDWIPAPDASTPDQVRMQVDWVRIYRR